MKEKNWYEEIAKEKASKFLDGRTRIYNENIIIVNMATASKAERSENKINYVNKAYYIEKVGDSDNLIFVHSANSKETFDASIRNNDDEKLFLRNMLAFEKKNGLDVVDGSETILFGGVDEETRGKFRSGGRNICLGHTSVEENQEAMRVFNNLTQLGETDLEDLVVLENALNAPKDLCM